MIYKEKNSISRLYAMGLFFYVLLYILIIFLSRKMHQHLVRVWGFLSESSDELGHDEQADNERWAGWSCHRDSGPWGTGGCGRADNLPEPSSHQSILSAD